MSCLSPSLNRGPIVGDVVILHTGGATPLWYANVTAVNGCSLGLSYNSQSAPTQSASNVPHDQYGSVTPSWMWEEELPDGSQPHF